MRDLRARLNEIAANANASAPVAVRAAETGDCFGRDTRVPLADLPGLLDVTREQLLRIDKTFLPDQPAAWQPDVRRFLFLDTETTGLGMGAGTVAFLLGLGWVEGDEFVVRQLLMRDYHEEPLLLAKYFDLLPRFDAVVTYNGKCFDMPLLENRLTMNRMRYQRTLPHLDLLHPARRVWRLRLGDCSLGNIEHQILNCGRADDLPGSEVPERFFSYLKTGDFELLEDVLQHNLLDIITLGKLLAKLAQIFAAPDQQSFLEDVFSTGRALERAGRRSLARRCFQVASLGALGEQARVRLALSYRGDQDFDAAARVYTDMLTQGQGGLLPYIELAKIAEHRRRDYPQALRHTEAALERLRLRTRLGTAPAPETLAGLEKRKQRLLRKLARGTQI